MNQNIPNLTGEQENALIDESFNVLHERFVKRAFADRVQAAGIKIASYEQLDAMVDMAANFMAEQEAPATVAADPVFAAMCKNQGHSPKVASDLDEQGLQKIAFDLLNTDDEAFKAAAVLAVAKAQNRIN